ncbi:MAG TPA: ABC transporter ATP-binding protein [Anaerolineae bacterium]|nr:ABC transporter ATP-binding protein [Anaerolineae bacterium]
MIVTKNLTKNYGNLTAVDKINLTIHDGESFGLLGPNGAGKTTVLMMLLGILKPTSGEVLIDGMRIQTDSFTIKRRIGVVAEYQIFYDEMTAWEYLMFFAKLFEVENFETRANDLLARINLQEWKDVLVGGFSAGMKKKLSFIRALIHSPDYLMLDEPVSGLDPFGIIQVRELLSQEQKKGTTILISSHILSEVEKTVARVGIMANGHLIAQDFMNNLSYKVGRSEQVDMKFANLNKADVNAFTSLKVVKKAEQKGNSITLFIEMGANNSLEEIGKCILNRQLVVLNMQKKETSLEEAFITITKNNLDSFTDSMKG